MKNHSSFGSIGSSSTGGGGAAVGSFLQNDLNINDPAVLRKKIAELEQENKMLRENSVGAGSLSIGGGSSYGSKPGFSSTLGKGTS